jgi:hypothetical protein
VERSRVGSIDQPMQLKAGPLHFGCDAAPIDDVNFH